MKLHEELERRTELETSGRDLVLYLWNLLMQSYARERAALRLCGSLPAEGCLRGHLRSKRHGEIFFRNILARLYFRLLMIILVSTNIYISTYVSSVRLVCLHLLWWLTGIEVIVSLRNDPNTVSRRMIKCGERMDGVVTRSLELRSKLKLHSLYSLVKYLLVYKRTVIL